MGHFEDHDYVSSERSRRRAKSFPLTSANAIFLKQENDKNHRCLEWRIQNEGFVPSPKTMAEHEKWRAEHPELYTNPHK